MVYRRPGAAKRRGVTVVECAVVYPVLFLFVLGLIVGGLGVFRYQEMAWLSREAARYAAVRAADYQSETGKACPTQQQITDNVVLKMGAALQKQDPTVTVQWIDKASGTATAWDSASKAPTGTGAKGETISNHVRVTVTYKWMPEALLVGPITLKSTCEIPLSF